MECKFCNEQMEKDVSANKDIYTTHRCICGASTALNIETCERSWEESRESVDSSEGIVENVIKTYLFGNNK